jgi:hypothetical protein
MVHTCISAKLYRLLRENLEILHGSSKMTG